MTIRENNKKLMKNKYFIKISCKIDKFFFCRTCKIDKLTWVFWKCKIEKVGSYAKMYKIFYTDGCGCFNEKRAVDHVKVMLSNENLPP